MQKAERNSRGKRILDSRYNRSIGEAPFQSIVWQIIRDNKFRGTSLSSKIINYSLSVARERERKSLPPPPLVPATTKITAVEIKTT